MKLQKPISLLYHKLASSTVLLSGPCSVVDIATGNGLEDPAIESRWGMRFSAPVQTGPGAHPASCTVDIGVFPGIKSGWGVTLTPHPLLVPWSWNGRAKPLLPLWVIRSVQSLSGCTMVHFTLLYCWSKLSTSTCVPNICLIMYFNHLNWFILFQWCRTCN